MKAFIVFAAVVAVAVANPLPLVQIIVNVDAPSSSRPPIDNVVIPPIIDDYEPAPSPVPEPPIVVPELPIVPEPVILPEPVLPEIIVPEPVILPEPTLPEVDIIPAPVILPEPTLPEIVEPVDLPDPALPIVVPPPIVIPDLIAPAVMKV